jgi:4-hydroxybenzoate polyprenyltransferase
VSFEATLRLLSTSIIVAVSGGFRLYIAFILLGREPELALCLAMILIVYATYTLDRAVKTKEDEINRKEEESANKDLAIFMTCASLLAAIIILIKQGISPLIAFFPLIIGFVYSKGIKIRKISLKLKQNLGIKNLVVGFTWASTICALLYPAESLQLLLIFTFFFLKSFINTVIFDYKDVKGDSLAGLTTLPIYFGEAKTKAILLLLHASLHLSVIALIILKLAEFEMIILLYSWMAGMIYIPLYANSNKTIFRSAVIHGEWAHMLVFRNLTLQLSRSASHSS